jgi:predicted ribosome quality control (RQC) complex YloA/Tae2 family protein
MKQRISSLDLRAIVSELQALVNGRLQNIYDVNSRTFSFKFGQQENKEVLLVESGIRAHLTVGYLQNLRLTVRVSKGKRLNYLRSLLLGSGSICAIAG